MLLRLDRNLHMPDATLGVLQADDVTHFATREDPVRADGVFVPGETALPPGLYNLRIARSRRFDRDLPLIVATRPAGERRRAAPRLGMFFHPGEPEVDLGGEILLGMALDGTAVRQSDFAFRALSAMIRAALDRGEAIEVEIN